MANEKNKEALAIVKQMIADGQVAQDVAEKYFPELKESEDEEIMKRIKYFINATSKGELEKYAIIKEDAIAWIEKQGAQKSKWSDEDKEMIDRLIRHCKKEHEELCNDKYGHQEIVSDLKRSCRERWDWLESLKNKIVPQSQWKPTKGQIGLLQAIVNEPNNAASESCQIVLKEVIRQLKKLKE